MTNLHFHPTPAEQARLNQLWSDFARVVNEGHGALFPKGDPEADERREKAQAAAHENALAKRPPVYSPSLRERVILDEDRGVYNAHRMPQRLDNGHWTEQGPLDDRREWLFRRFEEVRWHGQRGEVLGARFWPTGVERPKWAKEDEARRKSQPVAPRTVGKWDEDDFHYRRSEVLTTSEHHNEAAHERHEYVVLLMDSETVVTVGESTLEKVS